MKNKLLIYLFIISFLFLKTIYADILTYDKTIPSNETNITNIINLPSNYIIISSNTDTSISSYNNNNKLIANKKIENLINSTIINYNNNIFLIGTKNNKLCLYLLDSNLRIISSKETSSIINSTNNIKPYIYDNKIYLTITKNNILSDNNIYEIDNNLNITEKSFSSYINIKDILKSDYYLIKYNDLNNNYYNGTILNNNYILIGEQLIDNISVPSLTIYNDNNTITSKTFNQFNSFNKIIIIKDKIAILAYKETDSYLLLLDNTGTIINEIKLNNNITDMYKVGNQIFFTTDNNNLLIYKYELNIITNSPPYGTITVPNNADEFDTININVIPNSGYKLSSITLTNAYGNTITLTDNKFIMSDTDIYLQINYEETITNPNTVDLITIFTIILLITLIIGRHFYKKYKWLK